MQINKDTVTNGIGSPPNIGNTFVSCRLEILRASYWEHFKTAKDLALYLEPTNPKRIILEKELNEMLSVLNGS